ncbi:MAG: putative xanthine dehydrogenase subunit A [Fimbriimonadaceae bacterium]|nr:putative xanthine dehydrogenase subunit A [Fimbriimonadaceae bacterium]
MGVREDGVVVGSVSGGCVEPAVMQAAIDSLASKSSTLLDFGSLSDESVWEVGLSCGGRIRIFVQPEPYHSEAWQDFAERIDRDEPVSLVTDLSGGGSWIAEPGEFTESVAIEREGRELFVQVFGPRNRLVIIGAVHIAVPLIKFARELGFETVLIDPRLALSAPERFPVPADHTIVAWPEEALSQVDLNGRIYAAVLTHDPKIDDVALTVLLRSKVAYIGALGSRVTQEKRRRYLDSQGFSESDLERIHGPIGLDIGARSPEEIALSIMAEIVQVGRANR